MIVLPCVRQMGCRNLNFQIFPVFFQTAEVPKWMIELHILHIQTHKLSYLVFFVSDIENKNVQKTTKLLIFFGLVEHVLVNGSRASSANLMSRISHLLRISTDTKSTDTKAIDDKQCRIYWKSYMIWHCSR